MRHFITKSLELVCYVAMFLIIVSSVISGGEAGGFIGMIVGLVGGFIASIVLFGALFLLMDIAENTRRTADALERSGG